MSYTVDYSLFYFTLKGRSLQLHRIQILVSSVAYVHHNFLKPAYVHTHIHNLFFFKMSLFLENQKKNSYKHTYFQYKRNLIYLLNLCKCIYSALKEKLTFAAALILSSKLPPSQKS